jgi:large subunit ribosomal protein L25
MAQTTILEAKVRKGAGGREARKVRQEGMIPAVLYGHKEATIALAVPHREFDAIVRSGQRMIDLKIDAKQQKALIKDVQYDYMGDEILHVDFTRVSLTEKITLSVPVEMVGHAPGQAEGGVLDMVLKSLEVKCLPTNIPESIKLSISELKIGDSIFVKNVPPIEGVEVLNDPEAIVITVHQPKEEVVAAPAAEAVVAEGAAAAAEPEVIGEKERLERAAAKEAEDKEKGKEKKEEKAKE